MTEPKPVSQVLLEAANILERDGWCQGRLWAETGECCARGAVLKAVGGAPLRSMWAPEVNTPANIRLFCDAIDRVEGLLRGHDLAQWNDRPRRTASEVIAKLREAAAHA